MSDTQLIKEKLSIVDIIGGYIKVEKTGANFRACCPFHNEKTPSFFISPERDNYYCFGCGAKGDIFSFVEHMDGTDFVGALNTLADKAGVTLSGKKDSITKDTKDELYKTLERATTFFEENLVSSVDAYKYLIDRGIDAPTIKLFRLGYAKNEWKSLYETLLKEGYKKDIMVSAGLIKEQNGKIYDRFRDRIIFPIGDIHARIIGFSGRILHDDGVSAKYLNSPETILFKKGELLYGLDKAKDSIKNKNYSILVEGQIDLVLSHQIGITNTVASSGTALSDSTEQIKSLSTLYRLSKNLVMAFDGDNAGIKAMYRGGGLALKQGFDVKVVNIGDSQDPADIIKKDPKDWINILKKTENIIIFFINRISGENKNDLLKSRYVGEHIVPLIAKIPNPLDRDYYVKQVARLLNLNEISINKLLDDAINGISNKNIILTEKSIVDHRKDLLTPDKELYLSLLLSKDEDTKHVYLEKLEKILGNVKYNNLIDNLEDKKEELFFKVEEITQSITDKNKYYLGLYEDTLKMILKNELIDLQKDISKKELLNEDASSQIKIYQEKRLELESLS